jgi:hypothetical protein
MLARAAYGLIYLGIVAVAFLLPGWRDADWRIFAALRGAQPAWRGEIVLIDVPYSQTRAEYRGRLAALLEHFVKGTSGRPTLVVLDIAVDAATEEGLPRLAAVLRALARERVKLYAAVQPLDDSGYPTADYMSRHAQSIYRDLLDGHGHTLFQQYAGVLVYPPQLELPDLAAGVSKSLDALVVRIAQDRFGRPPAASAQPIVVTLGDPQAYRRHTLVWDFAGGELRPLENDVKAPLDERIVIVGSLAADKPHRQTRAGPELLAWALMERVARVDEATAPRLLDSPILFASLLLLLPAGSAAVFHVARGRLGLLRGRDWLTAMVAVLAGIALLVAVAGALRVLGLLYVQVTLVIAGIVAAVALAWFAAFQREVLASLSADLESGKLQAAESYDVFISYSRAPANASWVEEHVFQPLAGATRADGRALRVFFDRSSLRLGDFWYRRLALAIAGSRYFVPIYCDEYFDKAFCIHEITLAMARCAQRPGFVLPIRRTSKPVPEGYGHIQHVDVAQDPKFIEQVLARVTR